MKRILIIGGKEIPVNIKPLIESYEYVCRINTNLYEWNDKQKNILFVNTHVNTNLVKGDRTPEELINTNYWFLKKERINNFRKKTKREDVKIIQQMDDWTSNFCDKSNKILEIIKCPYRFVKQPRCGYQAILYFILSGYTVDVCGFSFKNENNKSRYTGEKTVSDCHDTKLELKVLYWLHENKKINATLCMLEDFKLPFLNCENKNIDEREILYFLYHYGICIIRNFYDEDDMYLLKNEYNRVFNEYKEKIEILDKEDCSNDERIFHTERYSDFIKNTFSNKPLFNKIAQRYNQHLNKKTLINKLVYEEGKVKNSGAGWHRDNHDCQFKTIMYLSDVKSENGPFTWITNSSKHHIGYPEPRTQSYNTRFHEKTIEKMLNENKNCEKIEVCGSAGDIILANTTYIHRGKVIEKGIREAMTEYFF